LATSVDETEAPNRFDLPAGLRIVKSPVLIWADRKGAEESLREREEFLRMVMQKPSELIGLFNPPGQTGLLQPVSRARSQ
jgi:hypothetical protein